MCQALANLRVPKAASKLMKFYAAQGNAFRPSLSRIETETGLAANHISRIRQLLVRYGLISYDGDNIYVDWLRLKGFAFADPKQIGQKQHWQISPITVSKQEEPKNGVHNYIGKLNLAEQRIYAAYAATAQALVDGVKFPELEGKELPAIEPEILEDTKNGVHNYIGDENSCGWYNPFDEPDPWWVYQVPVLDAYGQVIAFAHYDTQLPF